MKSSHIVAKIENWNIYLVVISGVHYSHIGILFYFSNKVITRVGKIEQVHQIAYNLADIWMIFYFDTEQITLNHND